MRTSGDIASGGRQSAPYFELDPPPQWVSFEELLATSDVISMHANLSKHSRQMKKLQPLLNAINGQESALKELSDDQLKAKIGEFREQIDRGKSLDDLMVDVYAVVREAGRRTGERLAPKDVRALRNGGDERGEAA